VLEDPENLILPQNVVPIVSDRVDEGAQEAIDAVNEVLTTEDLQMLNAKSTEDKETSAAIATEYLTDKGLL
jgi:osmoprotectant transport system substrate-binding protein